MGLSRGALWAYNSEPAYLIGFYLRNQAEALASASNLLLTEMWPFSSPGVPTSLPQPLFTAESFFFILLKSVIKDSPLKPVKE